MNVGFVKTIQSRIQKKYYSFLLKDITFRQIWRYDSRWLYSGSKHLFADYLDYLTSFGEPVLALNLIFQTTDGESWFLRI